MLCADGPVRSLVELSLVGEHRRGHGALYDALSAGRVDVARLRRAVAAMPLPRTADGRLVLAADLTCWLRPSAHTSPQRILCHTYGRGKDQHIPVPGWPYSVICALETGRSSWTAPLDALRLAPGDDAATVTARQMRELVERLITAGQWPDGDPEILVVVDAGYDVPCLAFLLQDLPVQVLGRMRSDGVLRRAVPSREPGVRGRPPRHGGEFVFGDPATWGTPDARTVTTTRLYGTANARAWSRLHPRLTHHSAWTSQLGALPLIEGTVIRLQVEHLPSGATPKPVWLWWSGTDAGETEVDTLWQAFLRRFDIEHTFRLFKQTLGWTCPKIRTPEAADRWTWLILSVFTQLRLARPLAADLRRPWEKPTSPYRLTPHESAATFGTSARRPPAQPKHRNSRSRAQDGHPAARTASPPHATTCTPSANPAPQSDERRINDPTPTPHRLKIKLGRTRSGPNRRTGCRVDPWVD
uniref:NF041680 family putative transposase n=1 Tax=Streptomyces sp. DSM 41540 TaxID=3448657 RepID=UPI00404026BB